MGYAHYWKRTRDFTDTEWAEVKGKVTELLGLAQKIMKLDVTIEEEEIWFNGIGKDSYETCCINKKGQAFDFCKTARKPYDGVVITCLKIMRDVSPESVTLSSDGGDEVFND